MPPAAKDAKVPTCLRGFRPWVAKWVAKSFDKPSPIQRQAWPAIRRGDNALLLAPTGSGKTLAAFLGAIDALYAEAERDGELGPGIRVLYISPLKALGNDIHRNLEIPLAGIPRCTRKRLPEIRAAVRSGDTSTSDREKMVRRPPHILITTPESLYILLASERMRPHLARVRTVIVDEIHSVYGSKRGTHLALSLERLEALVDGTLQRVGCSATISPLEGVARFLVGVDDQGRDRPVRILDAGARKRLDVKVEAPLPDFLEASFTALWSSAYEKLVAAIRAHRTTLIFCNSRYKVERSVIRLRELAPDLAIGAHHGSMDKELRLAAETDLKEGRLDALVATSSLELGIDVGAVDLVYQLESPRTVAAGLQRVGRAGHLLDATSKGRILVFNRNELLECGAICRAMLDGAVDAVTMPENCLDVLAQQLVGAAVDGDTDADALYALVRRAHPYRDLSREDFDAVLALCAGEQPGRPPRPAKPLVLWDRSTDRVTAARGAKHVCVQCAGTIPEGADYDVVIGSTGKRVGTLGAEFVDDTLRIGDIFVLGSNTWRMTGVRKRRLEVEPAPGSAPTVPWWTGPVASRTVEVGCELGRARRALAEKVGDPAMPRWLEREYRLDAAAAEAAVGAVREQQVAAEVVPDHERFLVETWRDELGRVNLIVHSPLGERLLRTWGIALVTAAKHELGQDWSLSVTNDLLLFTLREETGRDTAPVDAARFLGLVDPSTMGFWLEAAVAGAAGSRATFRDAAVCSFQIQRAHKGRRRPVWFLAHDAEEYHAAVGDLSDHPLVREVRREYLHDVLDLPGLGRLLEDLAAERVVLAFRETVSPAPFAHEFLVQHQYRDKGHQVGRERRAQLLRLHREVLSEVLSEKQLAQLLDQRAIDAVAQQRGRRDPKTRARDADELAQALRDVVLCPAGMEAVAALCDGDAVAWLAALVKGKRVVAVKAGDEAGAPVYLVTADRWRLAHAALAAGKAGRERVLVPRVEEGRIDGFDDAAPARVIPAKLRRGVDPQDARRELVGLLLAARGPVSAYEVANLTGWGIGRVTAVLDALVEAGGVAKGIYTELEPTPQWVDKKVLEEIHRRTLRYLKRELEACAPYEVVDFLTRWQHRHPDTRLSGRDGLREVIRQLQGYEVMQGALEHEVLGARLTDYTPALLDELIASGEVVWRRVSLQRLRRGVIGLCLREDLGWLATGGRPQTEGDQAADADIKEEIVAVREWFRGHGSGFIQEVAKATGVGADPALRAVWHLCWCGELMCDSFEPIRHAGFNTSLSACYDLDSTPRKIVNGRMSAARVTKQMRRRRLDQGGGRWWATERLRPPVQPLPEVDVVRRWARQLLDRWGIISKDVLVDETAAPAWGRLVKEYKRLELLGEVQRGFFIDGHHGVQYGLPEAVELLRDCRARREEGRELGLLPGEPLFVLSNRDPANLYTRTLDVIDERGEVVTQRTRAGNLIIRLVVQAGQVVLLRGQRLLATLDADRLHECFRLLRDDGEALGIETRIRHWNGWQVAASEVAGLLGELGFRLDTRGDAVWPVTGGAKIIQGTVLPTYEPYFTKVPPKVTWNREKVLEAVEDNELCAALARWIKVVVPELERRGWDLGWNGNGPTAHYRGTRTRLQAWGGRTRRCFVLTTGGYRDADGRRHRLWRETRIGKGIAMDGTFWDEFWRAVDRAQELTERFDRKLQNG